MIARPQQQLQPAKAQPQLRPGANVLMGKNPLGAWFDSTPAANDFRHPFTVNAGGGSARVSRGLVIANIAVEPLIGKVPVGGDDKNPQPVLKLDPSLVDAAGHSWICVEVTPDENGNLDAEGKNSKVEVVQRTAPTVTRGKTGRTPLAQIFYAHGQPQCWQVAYFNFRYETSVPASGQRRHFFL